MSDYKLSHLQELEAESIHIIREVAAEFENPVMLYSIGKDSSVMVRLAEKAFAPGKVPFPEQKPFRPDVPKPMSPCRYYTASPDSRIPQPLRG